MPLNMKFKQMTTYDLLICMFWWNVWFVIKLEYVCNVPYQMPIDCLYNGFGNNNKLGQLDREWVEGEPTK